MMRIESRADIRASVDQVWSITEDVERWPSITPTITSVERLDEGPLRLGSTVRIAQPRQRPAIWTVTAIEPGRYFEWQTKVFGITMTGSHRLEAIPDGCRNWLGLELSGFGSKLLGRIVGGKLQQAIDTENKGFKQAAEAPNDVAA
jgi:uncharacterized membrane protein